MEAHAPTLYFTPTHQRHHKNPHPLLDSRKSMTARAVVLELSILGLSHQPIHGYELREQLTQPPSPLDTVSWGTLYPALHRMNDTGLLHAQTHTTGRRVTTYTTTSEGNNYLSRRLPVITPTDRIFTWQLSLAHHLVHSDFTRLIEARLTYLNAQTESLHKLSTKTTATLLNQHIPIELERLSQAKAEALHLLETEKP